jgi:RHS repeat-associated protein
VRRARRNWKKDFVTLPWLICRRSLDDPGRLRGLLESRIVPYRRAGRARTPRSNPLAITLAGSVQVRSKNAIVRCERSHLRHLTDSPAYNDGMLCESSFRRLAPHRTHTRQRANLKTAHGVSKRNRSCRWALANRISPRKTRRIHACANTTSPPRSQCSQQYSITALTDSSGNIKERYAYSAYGELTITDGSGTVRSATAEGNRYTYTGREWDEDAELYHYRARVYDPLSGRFSSRDPIGYEGSPWNLYAYVASDPTNGVDPTGMYNPLTGRGFPHRIPWTHQCCSGKWIQKSTQCCAFGRFVRNKRSDTQCCAEAPDEGNHGGIFCCIGSAVETS